MKVQSNSLPVITQYDANHVAVPINIVQVVKDDETFYEYDLLIVQQGTDEVATAVNAVQLMMDTEAATHGYDNIFTACTYATSTNATFAAEGNACVRWRDAVWSACYQILNDVASGLRSKPSLTELLNELPKMVWPQ